MSVQSFDAIAPVVIRYAATRLKCPYLQSLALTLAWYCWRQANRPELPPSVWARMAVRQVLSGRDLPGVRSKFRDAWDHLEQWQGAGMDDVMERKPGPVQTVLIREEVERFFATLGPFEQEMCQLLADGLPNQEVARRMGRTPSAISQRRRRLADCFYNS